MKKTKSIFTFVIYIFSTLIASILIFLILNLFWVKQTAFNPDYYEKIFDKNSIYKETNEYLNETLNEVIRFIRISVANSENINENDKEILDTLQSLSNNTINESMIRDNLTDITNGLINYIKGTQNHLPDINYTINPIDFNKLYTYISQLTQTSNKNTNLYQYSNSEVQTATSNKLNLGLILMYFPDYHIDGYLKIVKTLYYAVDNLLLILISILIILLFAFIAFNKKIRKTLHWFSISSIISSIVGIGFSIFSLNFFTSTKSLIIAQTNDFTESIVDIVKDFIITALWLSVSTYIVLLFVMLILDILPRIIMRVIRKNPHRDHELAVKYLKGINKVDKTNILIKRTLCFIFIICLCVFSGYRTKMVKAAITKTDLSLLSPSVTTSAYPKVIEADNDTLYTLNVVIKDELTHIPISGVKYRITNSEINNTSYIIDETLISDDNGVSTVQLFKGSFKLDFDKDFFPEQYTMPQCLYFNLERSGQATLNIRLSQNDSNVENSSEASSTFLRILLIDSSNNPIEGITIKAKKDIDISPEVPEINEASEVALISVSNAEGSAVFKLTEDDYTLSFMEDHFPDSYVLPQPILLNSENIKDETEIIVQIVEKSNVTHGSLQISQ